MIPRGLGAHSEWTDAPVPRDVLLISRTHEKNAEKKREDELHDDGGRSEDTPS